MIDSSLLTYSVITFFAKSKYLFGHIMYAESTHLCLLNLYYLSHGQVSSTQQETNSFVLACLFFAFRSNGEMLIHFKKKVNTSESHFKTTISSAMETKISGTGRT